MNWSNHRATPLESAKRAALDCDIPLTAVARSWPHEAVPRGRLATGRLPAS